MSGKLAGRAAVATGAGRGIAAAVAYLASDDTSFVNGSVLGANGGSYYF